MKRSTARLARMAAPATVLAGAAALMVAGVPAQAANAPHHLGPKIHTHNGTVTTVFNYTGAEQTYAVPSDITSVTITAVGAAGQVGAAGGATAGAAGTAAMATSAVGVTPGATLFVEVGGTGAQGGFNGGAAGNAAGTTAGGRGGGASDVRTIIRTNVALTLGSRLVVAGGGGGGGGGGTCGSGNGGAGGAGANTGATASPGILCGATAPGTGGGGATPTLAGTAGNGGAAPGNGTAGAVGGGDGGAGGGAATEGGGGGGGGGGVFGGGGGGAGALAAAVAGGGGGGGGGSSLGTLVAAATGSASVTISYTTSSTLAITTSSPLPGGTVGHSYSATLGATGGTSPYTWALIPGSVLPAGLSLSTGGVISGTPTANGTKSFTVEVTDAALNTADKTFSLTVGSHSHADLAILLSHHGVFRHDKKGTYELQVTNTGGTATSATTEVTLLVPSGVRVVHGGSGAFWQCTKHKHTSFCSRSAKINGHDTTTITVKVKIRANKGTLVKSKATVSPSDSSPADNTSVDFAIVHKK